MLANDVIGYRQAQPGAFVGGLGGEEGIEYLIDYIGLNTCGLP